MVVSTPSLLHVSLRALPSEMCIPLELTEYAVVVLYCLRLDW